MATPFHDFSLTKSPPRLSVVPGPVAGGRCCRNWPLATWTLKAPGGTIVAAQNNVVLGLQERVALHAQRSHHAHAATVRHGVEVGRDSGLAVDGGVGGGMQREVVLGVDARARWVARSAQRDAGTGAGGLEHLGLHVAAHGDAAVLGTEHHSARWNGGHRPGWRHARPGW